MSAAAAKLPTASPGHSPSHSQSTRETVESIIVAFILAFLFRAFVAEAFVIPTGSMAPTLMGAHKDIFCEHCGQEYQASASSEFVDGTQVLSPDVTIASTCATCRGLNAYNFAGNRDHGTFSGDRILVSKFDYVFNNPQRWDVLVFKYPKAAHMNYIKRLIGLPGESLLIQDGDIYTRTDATPEWTIARKSPSKIHAMRRIVSDTNFQAPLLVKQGWPSLWQPLADAAPAGVPPPDAGWKVTQSEDSWQATLASGPDAQWLRYYHKFLDDEGWYRVLTGGALGPVDPYGSTLVTDYLAYNSSTECDRDRVYRGNRLRSEIDADTTAFELAMEDGWPMRGGVERGNDGYHWVGDLLGEFDVEIASDSGTLLLDLVEFGVHFQCAIDVTNGQATLSASGQGVPPGLLSVEGSLTAQTAVRGQGSYHIEFANFDDSLVLWINGSVIDFNQPVEFDSRQARATSTDRRPYWSESDPLDAAPVAIGGRQIALTVNRARVYRDIYYIAVQGGSFAREYSDYELGQLAPLLSAIPDSAAKGQVRSAADIIAAVYSHPQWWDQSNLFSQRGTLGFQLEKDQYFPMGDNSSASSDARAWVGHNYVEQRFLLGKALLVFWPHTWNTPVPFTPNFSRMGMIR